MTDAYRTLREAGPHDAETIIAIPTFRRPALLRRLLEALRSQEGLEGAALLIADNDAAGQQGAAVAAEMARDFPVPIEILLVPQPGLCHVRNALVAQALGHRAMQRLVMIDDDEWPQPGWLAALLAMQARTGAAVVGGPVDPCFAGAAPDWAEQTLIFRPEERSEGRTTLLYAGNNLLVSAEALEALEAPWFDPAFDRSGGEDLDFLTRIEALGLGFAWAPRARVNEWVGPERARRGWVLRRMWRIGVTDTMVARKAKPGLGGRVGLGIRAVGLLGMRTAALPALAWARRRRLDIAGQWVKAVARLYAIAGGSDAIYAAPAPVTARTP
ncbi:glycosyltransferase family 2 protein [Sphingomonas sp. MMS12-HWE2-04]|uniref:glycosyltransferase family 2 protein n=1 Tax=Sphingomonas sp. MMS12-HWE2-04 TaxID=3234199 RepID=UPI00384AEB80